MEEEVPNERWKMINHCHHLHLWSWQVISFSFFLLKVIAFDSNTLSRRRSMIITLLAFCEEEK
jgi:hypothetical protein